MENATSPNTQDKGARRASFVGSVLTSLSTRLVNHLALGAACFGLGDGLATLPQAKAAGTAPLAAGGVVSPSTDVVTLTTNIPNVAIRPTQFRSAKEAVDFYRLYVLPATLNTAPLEWTGNFDTMQAGTISEAHSKQIQTYVNALRAMAGVPGGVQFLPKYNAAAQQVALVGGRKQALVHKILPTEDGYTPEANEAAGWSILSLYKTPNSIQNFMADIGVPSVGHRGSLLNPGSIGMGIGSVSVDDILGRGFTAIYCAATEPYNPNVTPRDFFEFQSTPQGANLENQAGAAPANDAKGFHAIAWPPKGYVPVFVVPWDYLSMFGAQGNIDFSQAKVQMSWADPWGDTTKGITTAEAPIAYNSTDRVVWKRPTGCGFNLSVVESNWKIVIRDIRKYSDDSRSGPYELCSVEYTVTGCNIPRDAEGNLDNHTLSTIEEIRYDRDSGSLNIEATVTPGHQYQVQFNEADLDTPGAWFDYGSPFTATASSHELVAKLTGELLEGGNKGGSKLWIRLVDKTQQQ